MLLMDRVGINNLNGLNGLSFIDALTIFSVVLQVIGYQSDRSQATTDDLMEELQKQDRAYLDKIIENQETILKKLADLG